MGGFWTINSYGGFLHEDDSCTGSPSTTQRAEKNEYSTTQRAETMCYLDRKTSLDKKTQQLLREMKT